MHRVDIPPILLHLECRFPISLSRRPFAAHPRLTCRVVSRSRDSSSSSPENSARSAARTRARSSRARRRHRRRCQREDDDARGRRRRDSGDAPIASKSNKLKRAEELNAQARRRSRSHRRGSSAGWPACRRREALKRQYHAMRDLLARYRVAARGSPAVSGEVRRHPAGAADQRRHVLRVPGSGGHQAGQRRAGAGRVVPQRRAQRCWRRAQGQLAFDFRLDAAPAKILALATPPRRRPRGAAHRRRRRRAATRRSPRSTSARRRRSTMATSRSWRRRRPRTARRSSSIRISWPRSSTSPTSTTAATSWSRRRRSTSGRSASSPISSRRTSTSATSTTTSAASPRRRPATARRCGSIPLYADAHFYLAVTLEKMGLSQDARPHWRAYQQLAPNGEWVELAKEFSE